jgi:hypothetical protein
MRQLFKLCIPAHARDDGMPFAPQEGARKPLNE